MRWIIAILVVLSLSLARLRAGEDALAEVNAMRSAKGLRPFVMDAGLTQAAIACADYRAARLLFGHTGNDFQFVPQGTVADAAGCAAYADGGWLSCCMTADYIYAGAAFTVGRDGKRYMHLFVRGGSGRELVPQMYSPQSGAVGGRIRRRY